MIITQKHVVLCDMLRINIENFGKHEKAAFTFPERGMIRIDGKNGQGKSTLLNALCFALYGKPNKEIVTQGKRKTKVCLDYMEMQITRSTDPKRLVLIFMDETYEDEAAQNVIDVNMGMNWSEFELTSYIDQWKSISLLKLSPAHKLRFFEKISGGNESAELLDKTKAVVTDAQKKVDALTSKIAFLTKQVLKKQRAVDKLPETNLDLDVLKSQRCQVDAAIQDCKRSIETIQEELTSLRNAKCVEEKLVSLEKQRIELLKTTQGAKGVDPNTKDESLADMSTRLQDIERRLSDMKRDKADYQRLCFFESEVQKYLSEQQESLASDEKRLASYDIKKLLSREKELETAQTHLAVMTVRRDEQQVCKRNARKSIKRLKRWLGSEQVSRKLDKFKITDVRLKGIHAIASQLQSLTNDISLQIDVIKRDNEWALFSCPACETKLSYNETEVVEVQSFEESEAKVEVARSRCESLRRKEEEIKAILTTIGEIKEQYEEAEAILKQEDVILARDSSAELKEVRAMLTSVNTLKESIDKKRKSIEIKEIPSRIAEELAKCDGISFDKKLYVELKEQHVIVSKHCALLDKIEEERKRFERLGRDPSKLKDTEQRFEEMTTKYNDLCVESGRITGEIEKSYAQIRRTEIQQEIETLENKIDRLNVRLEKVNARLSGGVGFQESIKEAKVGAIQSMIDTVNISAGQYISQFTEEDISVEVEAWKTSRTGDVRPLMNVKVRHENTDHTDIRKIGGGLAQRCELAFLLAVSDSMRGQLLLLDECFNFVDQEAHVRMLKDLKRVCQDKLVVVISHEANNGCFDHVVNL